jgi:hypothetical protein
VFQCHLGQPRPATHGDHLRTAVFAGVADERVRQFENLAVEIDWLAGGPE